MKSLRASFSRRLRGARTSSIRSGTLLILSSLLLMAATGLCAAHGGSGGHSGGGRGGHASGGGHAGGGVSHSAGVSHAGGGGHVGVPLRGGIHASGVHPGGQVRSPVMVHSGYDRAPVYSSAGQRPANYGIVRPAPVTRQAPAVYNAAPTRRPIIMSGANATHGSRANVASHGVAPAGSIILQGRSQPTVVASASPHSGGAVGVSHGGGHPASFGVAAHAGSSGHATLSAGSHASFSSSAHLAPGGDHHLSVGGHLGSSGDHHSFLNPLHFGLRDSHHYVSRHGDHHYGYLAPFAVGLYAGSYGYWGSPGYYSDPYYTDPYYVDPSYYADPNLPVVIGPGYSTNAFDTTVNSTVTPPAPGSPETAPPVRMDWRRPEIPGQEAPEALPEELAPKTVPPKTEQPEETARPKEEAKL